MSIQPGTRRLVVLVLGLIALTCVLAEVFLAWKGQTSDGAMVALASVCAGALAGLVSPHGEKDEDQRQRLGSD